MQPRLIMPLVNPPPLSEIRYHTLNHSDILIQLNILILISTLCYIVFYEGGVISKRISLPNIHKWVEELVCIHKLFSNVPYQLESLIVI